MPPRAGENKGEYLMRRRQEGATAEELRNIQRGFARGRSVRDVSASTEGVQFFEGVPSTYTIRPGDTLSDIAARYYGGNQRAAYDIIAANSDFFPRFGDGTQDLTLRPNDTIRLPSGIRPDRFVSERQQAVVSERSTGRFTPGQQAAEQLGGVNQTQTSTLQDGRRLQSGAVGERFGLPSGSQLTTTQPPPAFATASVTGAGPAQPFAQPRPTATAPETGRATRTGPTTPPERAGRGAGTPPQTGLPAAGQAIAGAFGAVGRGVSQGLGSLAGAFGLPSAATTVGPAGAGAISSQGYIGPRFLDAGPTQPFSNIPPEMGRIADAARYTGQAIAAFAQSGDRNLLPNAMSSDVGLLMAQLAGADLQTFMDDLGYVEVLPGNWQQKPPVYTPGSGGSYYTSGRTFSGGRSYSRGRGGGGGSGGYGSGFGSYGTGLVSWDISAALGG